MKDNSFEFDSFESDKLNFVAKNLSNILLSKAEEVSIPDILRTDCSLNRLTINLD